MNEGPGFSQREEMKEDIVYRRELIKVLFELPFLPTLKEVQDIGLKVMMNETEKIDLRFSPLKEFFLKKWKEEIPLNWLTGEEMEKAYLEYRKIISPSISGERESLKIIPSSEFSRIERCLVFTFPEGMKKEDFFNKFKILEDDFRGKSVKQMISSIESNYSSLGLERRGLSFKDFLSRITKIEIEIEKFLNLGTSSQIYTHWSIFYRSRILAGPKGAGGTMVEEGKIRGEGLIILALKS